MNGRKGNLYRAWAGDTRVLSQVRILPPVVCQGCGNKISIRSELVVEGKCEACQAKKEGK